MEKTQPDQAINAKITPKDQSSTGAKNDPGVSSGQEQVRRRDQTQSEKDKKKTQDKERSKSKQASLINKGIVKPPSRAESKVKEMVDNVKRIKQLIQKTGYIRTYGPDCKGVSCKYCFDSAYRSKTAFGKCSEKVQKEIKRGCYLTELEYLTHAERVINSKQVYNEKLIRDTISVVRVEGEEFYTANKSLEIIQEVKIEKVKASKEEQKVEEKKEDVEMEPIIEDVPTNGVTKGNTQEVADQQKKELEYYKKRQEDEIRSKNLLDDLLKKQKIIESEQKVTEQKHKVTFQEDNKQNSSKAKEVEGLSRSIMKGGKKEEDKAEKISKQIESLADSNVEMKVEGEVKDKQPELVINQVLRRYEEMEQITDKKYGEFEKWAEGMDVVLKGVEKEKGFTVFIQQFVNLAKQKLNMVEGLINKGQDLSKYSKVCKNLGAVMIKIIDECNHVSGSKEGILHGMKDKMVAQEKLMKEVMDKAAKQQTTNLLSLSKKEVMKKMGEESRKMTERFKQKLKLSEDQIKKMDEVSHDLLREMENYNNKEDTPMQIKVGISGLTKQEKDQNAAAMSRYFEAKNIKFTIGEDGIPIIDSTVKKHVVDDMTFFKEDRILNDILKVEDEYENDKMYEVMKGKKVKTAYGERLFGERQEVEVQNLWEEKQMRQKVTQREFYDRQYNSRNDFNDSKLENGASVKMAISRMDATKMAEQYGKKITEVRQVELIFWDKVKKAQAWGRGKFDRQLGKKPEEQITKVLKYIYRFGNQYITRDRQCNLYKILAIALEIGVSTEDIIAEIFKHTNLCIYHASGLCVHADCKYSHNTDYKGILKTYWQQVNKKNKFKEPEPICLQVVKQWEMNLRPHMNNCMLGKKQVGLYNKKLGYLQNNEERLFGGADMSAADATRIMRQMAFGNVMQGDLAAEMAMIILYSYKQEERNNAEEVWEKKRDDVVKRRYVMEKAQEWESNKDKMQDEAQDKDKFIEDLVKILGEEEHTKAIDKLKAQYYKIQFLINPNMTREQLYNFTRLNACITHFRWEGNIKEKRAEEILNLDDDALLEFDDRGVFDFINNEKYRYEGNITSKYHPLWNYKKPGVVDIRKLNGDELAKNQMALTTGNEIIGSMVLRKMQVKDEKTWLREQMKDDVKIQRGAPKFKQYKAHHKMFMIEMDAWLNDMRQQGGKYVEIQDIVAPIGRTRDIDVVKLREEFNWEETYIKSYEYRERLYLLMKGDTLKHYKKFDKEIQGDEESIEELQVAEQELVYDRKKVEEILIKDVPELVTDPELIRKYTDQKLYENCVSLINWDNMNYTRLGGERQKDIDEIIFFTMAMKGVQQIKINDARVIYDSFSKKLRFIKIKDVNKKIERKEEPIKIKEDNTAKTAIEEITAIKNRLKFLKLDNMLGLLIQTIIDKKDLVGSTTWLGEVINNHLAQSKGEDELKLLNSEAYKSWITDGAKDSWKGVEIYDTENNRMLLSAVRLAKLIDLLELRQQRMEEYMTRIKLLETAMKDEKITYLCDYRGIEKHEYYPNYQMQDFFESVVEKMVDQTGQAHLMYAYDITYSIIKMHKYGDENLLLIKKKIASKPTWWWETKVRWENGGQMAPEWVYDMGRGVDQNQVVFKVADKVDIVQIMSNSQIMSEQKTTQQYLKQLSEEHKKVSQGSITFLKHQNHESGLTSQWGSREQHTDEQTQICSNFLRDDSDSVINTWRHMLRYWRYNTDRQWVTASKGKMHKNTNIRQVIQKDVKETMKQNLINNIQPEMTDKVKRIIAKNIKIATLNMRGMTTRDNKWVKKDLISKILDEKKLDIMVLTEVKKIEEEDEVWDNIKKSFNIISTKQESARGGVIALINKELQIEPRIIKTGSQCLIFNVSSKKDDRQRSIIKIAAIYINPQPNEEEKRQQILIEQLLINQLDNSNGMATIILGDMNSQGQGIMQRINKTRHLKLETAKIQFTRQQKYLNRQGQYAEQRSSPDQIWTRNIVMEEIGVDKVAILDHLMVRGKITQQIRINKLGMFTKKSVGIALESQDLQRQLLYSEFPYTSAEQLMTKFSNPKVFQTNLYYPKNINLDMQIDELIKINKDNQTSHKKQINSLFDKFEITENIDSLYKNLKMLNKAKSPNIIGHWKEADGFLDEDESRKKIAEVMGGKWKAIKMEERGNQLWCNKIKEYFNKEESKSQQDWWTRYDQAPHIKKTLIKELIDLLMQSWKSMNINKAHGTDLLPPAIKNKIVKVKQCNCETYKNNFTKYSKFINKFEITNPQIYGRCSHEDSHYQQLTDPILVKWDQEIATRVAFMIVYEELPEYLLITKMVCLSKNGSTTADKVKDIRPIGVLPVIYRLIEKMIKLYIDTKQPHVLETGVEQAGFKKGRSTLDLILIQSERMLKYRERLWFFLDIEGAYDGVKRDKMQTIWNRRVNLVQDEAWRSILFKYMQHQVDSYTVTHQNTIMKPTLGLIQGSATAPDMWNIYFQELLEKDPQMNKRIKNTRKLLTNYNKLDIQQLLMEEIILIFADDTTPEFRDVKEFQRWVEDPRRIALWEDDFGVKISMTKSELVQLNRSKKVMLNGKKQRLDQIINIRGVDIVIKEQVKYLGIPLNVRLIHSKDQQKKQEETQKMVKKKIQYLIQTTAAWRKIQSHKIQNVYISAIFRYYYTPLVISNNITIDKALETLEKLQRKVYRIPKMINNDYIRYYVPQMNWVDWWRTLVIGNKYIKDRERDSFFSQLQESRIVHEQQQQETLLHKFQSNTGTFKITQQDQKVGDPVDICMLCGECTITKQMEQPHRDIIFTDGSYMCSRKIKQCSYAVYDELTGTYRMGRIEKDRDREGFIRLQQTQFHLSNQIGEMLAMETAINLIIQEGRSSTIISDSEFIVKALNKWVTVWRKKNIIHKVKYGQILNNLKLKMENYNKIIKIQHIKAHQRVQNQDQMGNYVADILTRAAWTGNLHGDFTYKKKITTFDDDIGCESCSGLWKKSSYYKKQDIIKKMKANRLDDRFWRDREHYKQQGSIWNLSIHNQNTQQQQNKNDEQQYFQKQKVKFNTKQGSRYEFIKELVKQKQLDEDHVIKQIIFQDRQAVRYKYIPQDQLHKNKIKWKSLHKFKLQDQQQDKDQRGKKIKVVDLNSIQSDILLEQVKILKQIKPTRIQMNRQWMTFDNSSSEWKNSYIHQLHTIISAIQFTKGFSQEGVLVCKMCSTKVDKIRMTISHSMECDMTHWRHKKKAIKELTFIDKLRSNCKDLTTDVVFDTQWLLEYGKPYDQHQVKLAITLMETDISKTFKHLMKKSALSAYAKSIAKHRVDIQDQVAVVQLIKWSQQIIQLYADLKQEDKVELMAWDQYWGSRHERQAWINHLVTSIVGPEGIVKPKRGRKVLQSRLQKAKEDDRLACNLKLVEDALRERDKAIIEGRVHNLRKLEISNHMQTYQFAGRVISRVQNQKQLGMKMKNDENITEQVKSLEEETHQITFQHDWHSGGVKQQRTHPTYQDQDLGAETRNQDEWTRIMKPTRTELQKITSQLNQSIVTREKIEIYTQQVRTQGLDPAMILEAFKHPEQQHMMRLHENLNQQEQCQAEQRLSLQFL